MENGKRRWVVVAAVMVVALIGFLVIEHLLDADTYRGRMEEMLSDATGRQVQLGHLEVSLFSGNLVAQSLTIADDPAFSSQPFLTAKEIRIGVEMMPLLLHKQVHITGFTVEEPKITLLRAQNGVWNYSSLGNANKRKAPTAETNQMLPGLVIGKVEVKDGTVTVGLQPQVGTARVYNNLNVEMEKVSFASAIPFKLTGSLPAGGNVTVNGSVGPFNEQDASLTPLSAQMGMKHVDLVAAGFVQPEQGVAGLADVDAKVSSDGTTATATGKVNLTQLKLAKNGTPSTQPVTVQFTVDQDLKALSGKIDSANVQIGQAAMSLSGTYQTSGAVTTTDMDVKGQQMPVDALVAFLPSLGVQLPSGSRLQGGTLTTTLHVSGPVAAPVIAGPVQMANTQLAGFDLGSKLAGVASLMGAKTGSNTTIQSLSTNLRYGPQGTETDNLSVVVSGLGSVTGGGSIAPGGGLSYRLLVKLAANGTGGMISQAMTLLPGGLGAVVGQAAKNGIPLTIGGTTANPTFTPDVSRIVNGAAPQQQRSNSLGNVLGGLLRR